MRCRACGAERGGAGEAGADGLLPGRLTPPLSLPPFPSLSPTLPPSPSPRPSRTGRQATAARRGCDVGGTHPARGRGAGVRRCLVLRQAPHLRRRRLLGRALPRLRVRTVTVGDCASSNKIIDTRLSARQQVGVDSSKRRKH